MTDIYLTINSTISLISAQGGLGGQRHAPATFTQERPCAYCTGDWVLPRAGLDGCGKTRPTGIRSQDRLAEMWLYLYDFLFFYISETYNLMMAALV